MHLATSWLDKRTSSLQEARAPHDVTVIAGRGRRHWWAHGKGTKPQQQWFAEKLGRELQVEGDKGEYRK